MTEPTDPVDPLIAVLTRIAEAVENLAFQAETGNLLAYNTQPNTAVKVALGKRLDVDRVITE